MNISKKKYEKLNNDLVDAKVKAFNDVKKALDGENKIMRLSLQIKQQRDQYKADNERLDRENKALREQNYKYCKLGNHIRLKAENNPGVSRYIDLVNYIDRLERKE